MKTIKELKKGEYFLIKNIYEARPQDIWVKEDYDRTEKKYLCHKYANTSKWKYFKGSTVVTDVF